MRIKVTELPSEYWGIVSSNKMYELEKTDGPVILRPKFTTHLSIKWLQV